MFSKVLVDTSVELHNQLELGHSPSVQETYLLTTVFA